MEEKILEQLELGKLSDKAREDLLNKIADIIAMKLVVASADTFSVLEAGRVDYMAEQGDKAALAQEVAKHIPDPQGLLDKIAAETLAELREDMSVITKA